MMEAVDGGNCVPSLTAHAAESGGVHYHCGLFDAESMLHLLQRNATALRIVEQIMKESTTIIAAKKMDG
jgi:hypothetical protein